MFQFPCNDLPPQKLANPEGKMRLKFFKFSPLAVSVSVFLTFLNFAALNTQHARPNITISEAKKV